MKWLIEQFTDPGDSVIDPVCGSGTTCKAACQLGRHYLGIEIDEHIAQAARERLSRTQPPLLVVGNSTNDTGGGVIQERIALLEND